MTIHPGNLLGIPSEASNGRIFDRVIAHSGREFFATRDMAAIFIARAEDVIARHDTELVPLLHEGGVDLLLIGPGALFSVSNVHARGVGF